MHSTHFPQGDDPHRGGQAEQPPLAQQVPFPASRTRLLTWQETKQDILTRQLACHNDSTGYEVLKKPHQMADVLLPTWNVISTIEVESIAQRGRRESGTVPEKQ